MAQSVRDKITAAAVTALGGSGKPSGLIVHRFRGRPIGLDELPAMLVYAFREDVETGPGQGAWPNPQRKAKRSFVLRIESRIDASGSAPDAALDQYVSWATAALLADVTLGGICSDMRELATEWAAEEKDKVYAAAQQDFLVTYITQSNDQSS